MGFPDFEPAEAAVPGHAPSGVTTGALLDALSVLVLVLDPEGRIVFANRACAQSCHRTSAELAGTHVSALSAFPPVQEHLEQPFEAPWPDVERGSRSIRWSCRPVRDAQGALRLIACSGVDVPPPHEVEQAHAEALHFLQTLLDQLPNPIFFKSSDGLYRGCNVAFSRFLGLPRERIVGRTVHEVSPPALADVYKRRDDELLRTRGVQVYESSVRGANGEVRDVVFYKATYPDEAGEVAGLVGIILDITERRRAERALEEARNVLETRVKERTVELERLKDVAEAADRAKSEFLNIASHELRTPLTSLLMSVQRSRIGLHQGRPLRGETLDLMERHVRRLVRLARDLLDVSRLEQGQLAITRRPLDLRQPVRQAVEDFRAMVARRTFTLALPDHPVTAEVDVERVEQVVSDLLDNAVRYTPEDRPVEVVLRCQGRIATLTVTDHGPGIAPEAQHLLFRRYFRRDVPTAQAGMGLGLYLAQQIVHRHGGRISVESDASGSTFSVQLPARCDAGEGA